MTEKTIEYFYATYSSYTWLGSAKLKEIADAAGRRIVHRPVDLHRILEGAGSSAFSERTAEFKNYFFNREIERWASFRGLRTLGRRPKWHHHGYDLSNRVVVAAVLDGHNADDLSHGFLNGHWADDADLSDKETVANIIESVGLDSEALLQRAGADDVASQYEANTVEAIERNVFGSPTYFVDGDMFYGQDRLELVEHALKQPFPEDWPKS